MTTAPKRLVAFSLLTATLLSLSAAGCRTHAERGAVIGGLAGAAIGNAIGAPKGRDSKSTAVGAVIGTLAGAAIGSNLDEAEARNRALIAQQVGREMRGPVTIADVITMTQGGVGDQIIINHISYHGVAQPLTPPDLVTLKQSGVSDAVVAAMQRPPVKPVAAAPAPTPVIIEERHVYGPRYYPPPYRYRRYHHHHPHKKVRFGVSIHN